MVWQLQEAKQRLSEVVRRALREGPQVVTRHGKDAVVVVSLEEFERLKAKRGDFKRFLRSAPDLEGLEIARDRTPGRVVDL